MKILGPCSGTAFELNKGSLLKVTDIEGEQVSDFFCFDKNDYDAFLSNGRTFDYLNKVYVDKGDSLYSSKSTVLAEIIEDTVGKHDFLLTPCSQDTFRIIYNDKNPKPGCEGNLIKAFKQISPELSFSCLPTTLNLFMNVPINSRGEIDVLPPPSKAGDYVVIKANTDLIVGLTACTALKSNNGSCKPIGYEIIDV